MTVDAPLMSPVEAGAETLEIEQAAAPIERAKPGRKPLPLGQKIEYRDERVSMRTEYWKALQDGAEALNVVSLSGKNRGKPSWRAMIRFLCENMDWVIIAVRIIRRMSNADRQLIWSHYQREVEIRKKLAELEQDIERDTLATVDAVANGIELPVDETAVLIRANRIHGLRLDLRELDNMLEVHVSVPVELSAAPQQLALPAAP